MSTSTFKGNAHPANAGSVGIIILNYNGWTDTQECVESILRIHDCPYEIILLDNASTDGSYEQLRARFPDITLIRNDQNFGFAAGVNPGLRLATQHGHRYGLLLNNDALLDPGVLGELVAFASEHPEVAAVGPRIVRYDDPSRAQAGWQHGVRAPLDTISLSGSALLLRLSVLAIVGFLDPTYFMYWEERDFLERCRRSGFRTVYLPTEASVRHKIESTSARTPGLVDYYLTRNGFIFARRYGGLQRLLAHVITSAGATAKAAPYPARVRARVRGFRDGVAAFIRNPPLDAKG